ncbi:MAG: SAM-dependent methyltransferase [Oligoflexales bacterium]
MSLELERSPSSFRDPSGFVFKRDGKFFRQVNRSYKDAYELLMNGGLYDKLTSEDLLISHEDLGPNQAVTSEAHTVLKPKQLEVLSFPYEWSFSQLKDAALATLKTQETALKQNMILKDASAYNIQFSKGKPVFIDTLSFEAYKEGTPWIAYRQFCQHFLAPLALAAYVDIRLLNLLRIHIDGIPLDLASQLLPAKTKFKPGLLIHIHLHAKSQQKYADSSRDEKASQSLAQRAFPKNALVGLVENLKSVIEGLQWKPPATEWGDYYSDTNYSETSFQDKKRLVKEFFEAVPGKPRLVWDLGANTGVFSRCVAENKSCQVVAADIDPVAVEKSYRQVLKAQEENVLPLCLDLTNPSPGIGWGNDERASFFERQQADVIIALALIHHLAISNNVPLEKVAGLFVKSAPNLIIEFVPKSDSQVRRLLATRADVFPEYTKEGFEKAFSLYYDIVRQQPEKDTGRILYLMRKK